MWLQTHRFLLTNVLCITILFSFSACGGGGGSTDNNNANGSASVSLTPGQTGQTTVTINGATLNFSFPADSVSQPVTVTITQIPADQLPVQAVAAFTITTDPSSASLFGSSVTLTGTVTSLPAGTTLNLAEMQANNTWTDVTTSLVVNADGSFSLQIPTGASGITGAGTYVLYSPGSVNPGVAPSTLAITSVPGASCTVGQACQQVVAAVTGGTPPYVYSYGTMANGTWPWNMAINVMDSSGFQSEVVASGTPAQAGTYSFEVCAHDLSLTSKCTMASLLVNPAPACVYTYSDWGACQPDGTQARTVISSTPDGCTGTPVLTQSCTYSACVYTYSDWGACQTDSTQTRTVISSSPAGCTGTPVLSQSCTYTPSCCDCYFDVYCTVFGPGGCWYCTNVSEVGGSCPSPAEAGGLVSPGACTCDPGLYQSCY